MSISQENKENIANVYIQLGYEKNDPFHNLYEIDSKLTIPKEGKIFLGDPENKRCRFCNQDKSTTKFQHKAHIIPEFMGNKKYFSNFECDSCNTHFSAYESSLSNYGGILNTFSKLKGKTGYQKHKGINENTETYIENGNIKMLIHNPIDSSSEKQNKSIALGSKKDNITFNTNKYSYVPINAYKALIKIGFCMLDSIYLEDYESTRKWLLDQSELKINSNNPLFQVFQKIGGRLFPHPWSILMKKRKIFENQPSPSHVLLLFYGLFAFQIFLPGNRNDDWIWEKNKIILPIENHISYSRKDSKNNIKLGVDKIDFSSNVLIKNPKQIFSVDFKQT